mgnify:CR=1 FL=1
MSVITHTNAAGDVSIGVEHEGAFVPFGTLTAGRVAQFVQRHENLQKRAEGGDEQALGVLGSAFVKPKAKGSKAGDPEAGS